MELSGNERFSRDLRAAAGLLALALIATGTFGLLCGIALAVYVVVKIRPYLK